MRERASMLCVTCGHLGTPDTWVPGSERAELLAWCCLGFPGLVYCAWRHLHRTKHCHRCGDGELIREARASRRVVTSALQVARVRSAGPSPWPLPLHAPRQRLREGAAIALFGVLALVAAAIAALGSLPTEGTLAFGPACAFLGLSGVCVQVALLHDTPIGAAWDETGQRIEVECKPAEPARSQA